MSEDEISRAVQRLKTRDRLVPHVDALLKLSRVEQDFFTVGGRMKESLMGMPRRRELEVGSVGEMLKEFTAAGHY